jgi:DNA-binding LytR/AlgR family response regulator
MRSDVQSRRITAIIADDEPRLAGYLRGRLGDLWPELVVAGVAHDGPAAEALLRDESPDIAFLDIRMPGRSGLDVAAEIGAHCHVVFITAYDQYAVKAFDAGAADYLLKPVETDRLLAMKERMERKLATPPIDLSELVARLRSSVKGESGRMKWVKAAVGKQVKLIPVDEVLYFQSDTKYTRVVLANGEALIRTPLKDLLSELDPEKFWQVHRGTIVNLDAVSGVLREDAERQFIMLKNRQEKLPISRQFTHLFKQM